MSAGDAERRYVIGSGWQTVAASGGTGSGATGPTGPTGPTGAGGGGGGGVNVVTTAFAFDTPNILTGVAIYTPSAGEIVQALAISVTTVFDGTDPTLEIGFTGGVGFVGGSNFLTVGDVAAGGGGGSRFNTNPNDLIANAVVCDGSLPVLMLLDNGAGGDPGSTQGEGVVTLVVYSP